MFTRQHYKAIAKIVSDSTSIDKPDMMYRGEFINDLARLFKEDNPRFNRWKFIKACNDKWVHMMSIS